ncbi:MAG: transaldolase [Campylobacterota bacterium]|nr:transaldolase [Campylobacterota bacterium]
MVNRDLGFSLWLDFVERDFLKNKFEPLLEKGIVNGATSNPSIFASAITTSEAYKEQLAKLDGESPKEKYESLAIEDIKGAAQRLRPYYDRGRDGYISMEVDPFLKNDAAGTIAEAQRLFAAIDEPNVMIKVPATEAGYEAMYALISTGIPVNATLIFSPEQAKQCLKAMKKGLDEFQSSGGERVEAVLSVFVSRFDRLLDPILEEKGIETAQTGILNAARIYNIIEHDHTPGIRTLFASTGVKGDNLPEDYYIRELLAPHSVNTAPLITIESYIKEPGTVPKLPTPMDEIDAYFDLIASKGIDMDEVYNRLMEEGLGAFEQAFDEMLESIK